MIVVAAIAAAGNMNSSVAWKSKINQLIPEVAALLGQRSFQMRRALAMLDASVFTAPFVDAVLEETSKRLVVSFEHAVDRDHPDGRETIRTERTDTPTGKRMAERLHDVQPGQTLLCWKVLEEMRGGDNAGRSVRILMHTEMLPDRKMTNDQVDEASRQRVESQRAKTISDANGELPQDAAMQRFTEAVKDWNGKGVAAFVTDMRRANTWPPNDDNIDAIVKEAEKWNF